MVLEKETLQEMTESGHARRMGHIENYFAILQRQGLYKTFAVLARFNTNVNDKALLFNALRPLLLRYPTLAATIVDTDYTGTTIPRPIHDFIKVIDVLRLKDVLYELPEEVKSLKGSDLLKALNDIELPYADGNPLWKLAFLDDHTLVYITNHCLSDGITAKYLLQDLENEFEKLSNETFDTTEDYESKILLNYNSDKQSLAKLPSPIDSVVSYTPPFWYFGEYIFNLLFIKKFCFSSGTVSPTDKHIYRQVHIPAEELALIKKRLENNSSGKRITLTPLIQAAWLNAQYQSGILTNFTQMSDFSVPCDARQYLPPGVDQNDYKYGANTSGSHKFFYPVKKLTWSVVDYFNSYIKSLFQSRRFLYNLGIITLEFIGQKQNLDKVIKESYIGASRGNTVFSNLGLVHDSNNANYRIQDISFTQSAGSLIFNFAINSVSCAHGGMNLVITMAENAVPEEKFDIMVAKFEENLLSHEMEAS